MQVGYYATCWADIKNSPGWLGKLCLLALVSLIPIFGPIVVAGYLWGWARDIAWNVHQPMPQHLFGNTDGKLYSRGFFKYVIEFICSLIPLVLYGIYGWMMGVAGVSMATSASNMDYATISLMGGGVSTILYWCAFILSFFATVLGWVGSIRMSIYGTLGSGLQFGQLWKMIRRDPNGLMRILGMNILVGIVAGIVVAALLGVVIFIGTFAAIALVAGSYNGGDPTAVLMSSVPAIIVVTILSLLCSFVVMVIAVFTQALVARAMGYWARQFDVAHWRGQNEPLPFETMGVPAGYQAVAGQPVATQPVASAVVPPATSQAAPVTPAPVDAPAAAPTATPAADAAATAPLDVDEAAGRKVDPSTPRE